MRPKVSETCKRISLDELHWNPTLMVRMDVVILFAPRNTFVLEERKSWITLIFCHGQRNTSVPCVFFHSNKHSCSISPSSSLMSPQTIFLFFFTPIIPSEEHHRLSLSSTTTSTPTTCSLLAIQQWNPPSFPSQMTPFSIGCASYPSRIPTKSPNSTALPLPFSTFFISSSSLSAATSLAMALLSCSCLPLTESASSAQHPGFLIFTNDDNSSNLVLAVEFDSFMNQEFNDVNGNNVGPDVNSLTSVARNEATRCKQEKGSLILACNYMENGSLDNMIFRRNDYKENFVLTWEERIKIFKDVASGILYLHEGWESKVLLRDTKASILLLEKEMNARLADIGPAKMHHQTGRISRNNKSGTDRRMLQLGPMCLAPES